MLDRESPDLMSPVGKFKIRLKIMLIKERRYIYSESDNLEPYSRSHRMEGAML